MEPTESVFSPFRKIRAPIPLQSQPFDRRLQTPIFPLRLIRINKMLREFRGAVSLEIPAAIFIRLPPFLYRLLPLSIGLQYPIYLLRAKGPFDPFVVCRYPPQGRVLHLHLLQAVRQAGVALPHPAIILVQTVKPAFQIYIGHIDRPQYLATKIGSEVVYFDKQVFNAS